MNRKASAYTTRILSYALFLIGLVSPVTCLGEASELKQGLGYHEVVSLLGSPTEKIERESSRETLWLYEQRQLRFRNGKLYDWSVSATDQKGVLIASDEKQEYQVADSDNDVEVQDILSEIINDGAPEEEADRKISRRPRRR